MCVCRIYLVDSGVMMNLCLTIWGDGSVIRIIFEGEIPVDLRIVESVGNITH